MVLPSKFAHIAALIFAWVLLGLSPAYAMGMILVENQNGRSVLLMYGSIDSGDYSRFRNALNQSGQLDGVWLSSGGGVVDEASKIGQHIRALKIPIAVPSLERMSRAVANSYVPPAQIRSAQSHIRKYQNGPGRNICASACGMLLASGYIRFVDEPYSVGLHSSYYPQEAIDSLRERMTEDEFATFLQIDFQQAGVKAALFMQDMGIDVNYASVASMVPASCMYWLSAQELDELNVVNVRGHKTQGPPGFGKCSCGPSENELRCETNAQSIR